MWKKLKLLLPGKRCTLPDEIKFENENISQSAIANEFNKYFLDSINYIVAGIPDCTSPRDGFETISEIGQNFSKSKCLTMADIKSILKDMKNVAGGVRGISKKVLCDVAYDRLLNIVNTSLSSGKFPERGKESTVVPIAKVTNTTTQCHEFRPINTVEAYEKILETAVKIQLPLWRTNWAFVSVILVELL